METPASTNTAIALLDANGQTFNGSSDAVIIDNQEAFQASTGTLSFRFRPDDTQGTQGLMSKDSRNLDDGGHLTLWMKGDRLELRAQTDKKSFFIRGGTVTAGEWHDIDISWGEDGVVLSLNGTEVGRLDDYTDDFASNQEPFVFGANQWTSGDQVADNLTHFFAGEIADASITPEAITLSANDPSISQIDGADSNDILSVRTFTDSSTTTNAGAGADRVIVYGADEIPLGNYHEMLDDLKANPIDTAMDYFGAVHTVDLGADNDGDTLSLVSELDGTPQVMLKHTQNDGRINGKGVAGENDQAYDHWAGVFGFIDIVNFDPTQDDLQIAGHTTRLGESFTKDGDFFQTVYSEQNANDQSGPRAGAAHDDTFLGLLRFVDGADQAEAIADTIDVDGMENYVVRGLGKQVFDDDPTANQTGDSISDGPLLTFALVDAQTNEVVEGYESISTGDQIDLSGLDLTQYSVVAQVNPDHFYADLVESVKFESNLGNRTENIVPYALFGDDQGNFNGKGLSTGEVMLTATAYSKDGGKGKAIGSTSIDYSVVDSVDALPPTTPVDAGTPEPMPEPMPSPTPDPVANPEPTPEPMPDPTPGSGPLPDLSQSPIDLADFDAITFHFDGNNNDKDDIAALPIAAAIAQSAGLEDKTTFFYGNNLSEPNNSGQVAAMRDSAALAEQLGVDTYSYQDGIQQTTDELVKLLDSGQKVLAIEGGPMEAIYRALEQTSPANHSNITLLSHSSWNENRANGSRPGGGTPRTWSDIRSDFPTVTQIDIQDQNNGSNNDRGFNSFKWDWLDSTDNPVLQDVREKMVNADGKVNDPSDAGMLFYAITGNETADPEDAKAFFDQYPPAFEADPAPAPAPAPTPEPMPEPTPDPTPEPTPGDTSGEAIFMAENGQVVIEAESAATVGDWQTVSVDGETGLLWDSARSSYGKVPEGQTLGYTFETDEGGAYSIALRSGRVKAAMNGGDRYENGTSGKERTDTGNDAYVAIINAETGEVVQAPTKLFTGLGNSDRDLRWGTTFDANHRKSQAQVELDANTQYRLEITGRSDGYVLDRITLSNDGALKDADIAESALKESGPAPMPEPMPEPDPTPSPDPDPSSDQPLMTLALVNAETNEVVEGYEDLTTSDSIDLKNLDLDKYSIIAQVNPDHPDAGKVESVKFESNLGNQTESFLPYALFGDNQGDFNGKGIGTGEVMLKATAFSGNRGQGEALGSTTANYDVIDSSPAPAPTPDPTPSPAPAPDQPLMTLALVNAETNEVVEGYEDLTTSDSIDLKNLDLDKYSIIAQVNPDHPDAGKVESVKFESNLGNQTESFLPYALFGDDQGDFNGKGIGTGEVMLKATAFSGNRGQGQALESTTVNYSVVDTTEASAPSAPDAPEAPAPTPPMDDMPAEPAPPMDDTPAEPAPPMDDTPVDPAPPMDDTPAAPAPPMNDAPAEPAPPMDDPTTTEFANRVLELTNEFRAENGRAPLTLNANLTEAAQDHSEDMANDDFFSHTGADGSSVGDRIREAGYDFRAAGENIAAGQRTPEQVVQAWINSPGHRANLLRESFTEIGIGYEFLENDTGSVNYNHYWTQKFGRSANPTPPADPAPQPDPSSGGSGGGAPAAPTPPMDDMPAEPAPPMDDTPAEPAPPMDDTPVDPAPPMDDTPAAPAPPMNDAPAEPAPPMDDPTTTEFANRVLELTNEFRAENGRAPLTLNADLTEAAQDHSEDMANDDFFSHRGADGSSMSDRIREAGYEFRAAGENIAAGQRTPEQVVQAWINSPGHRANLLSESFTEIGIGYEFLENDTGSVNYNHYWTQNFGRSANPTPASTAVSAAPTEPAIAVQPQAMAAPEPSAPSTLDLSSLEAYGGTRQNRGVQMTLAENNRAVRMEGNGWRKLGVNYTITPDTMLTFEFRSDAEGEIHSVGFDANNTIGQEDSANSFRLMGTQDWGNSNFETYVAGSGWQSFRIPVGEYVTGEQNYLTFGNDDDAWTSGESPAISEFRNVSLYEAGAGVGSAPAEAKDGLTDLMADNPLCTQTKSPLVNQEMASAM